MKKYGVFSTSMEFCRIWKNDQKKYGVFSTSMELYGEVWRSMELMPNFQKNADFPQMHSIVNCDVVTHFLLWQCKHMKTYILVLTYVCKKYDVNFICLHCQKNTNSLGNLGYLGVTLGNFGQLWANGSFWGLFKIFSVT